MVTTDSCDVTIGGVVIESVLPILGGVLGGVKDKVNGLGVRGGGTGVCMEAGTRFSDPFTAVGVIMGGAAVFLEGIFFFGFEGAERVIFFFLVEARRLDCWVPEDDFELFVTFNDMPPKM